MRNPICRAAAAAFILTLGAVAAPAHGQAGGTNVAVIDIPLVFKNHARFQQAVEGIKKDIDAYKEYLMAEQQKIRVETEKLMQFKPGSQEYKDQEEKIARMKIEVQLEGGKRQNVFLERESKEYYNTYKEIVAVVARFAAANRIGLVLRFSSEEMDPSRRESVMQVINSLVVHQDRLDITDLVLQELNKAPLTSTGQPLPGSPAARVANPAVSPLPPR